MRRYHIALAAVALAAASFFIFGPASDKQRFHGKPLSFWLDQLDTGTNREAATAAVRAISTNALPALLRLVGTKPTDLDEIVGALREDYDVQFAHLDAEGARARGVAGFRALGPAGLGGAPALIKLADDFQFRADAEKSLLAIGPGAVNVLIDALGHDDTKISAANALAN